jgi:hypothetical protein
MHKSLQLAAALLLFSAATMAQAGPGLGADTLRVFSPQPRASSVRIPALSLPSPRTAAVARTATMTNEPPRTIPLDQPRLPRSFQESAPGTPEPSRNMDESSPVAFPIQWRVHPTLVSPELVSRARNFRRTGLPIVHLWQSNNNSNLVALGLSPRGIPGVYFTQRISN